MQRAGELLNAVLARAGIDLDAPQAVILRTWEHIAGDELAAHSRLIDVSRGQLLVEVDHPAWLQLCHLQQRAIIARARKRFPPLDIRRLHAVVGNKSSGRRRVPPPPTGRPRNAPVSSAPDEVAPADAPAAATGAAGEPTLPSSLRADPELAALLQRLGARVEARHRRAADHDSTAQQ